MAALLSPTKPVRTRFKVPGEGAYDLSLDLAPPLTRAPAPQASVSSGASASAGGSASGSGAGTASGGASGTTGGASSTGSSSTGNGTAKPSPGGNPLGLTRISKFSFAAHATLQQPELSNTPSASANSTSAASTAASSGSSSAPSTSTSTTSSIFSFRKLTALGLSKLSGNGPDDDQQTAASASRSNNTNSQSTTDAVHPRVPPRIASSASGNLCKQHAHQRPCSGVLAYNAGESLILLDVATRSTSELPLQPSSWAKAALSAHALTLRDGLLRAVIGLANGEVLYFTDIISAANAAMARRNASAANSGNSSSHLSMSSISMSMSMSMSSYTSSTASHIPPPVIYNRDGVLNHSRVVALQWLPNSNSSNLPQTQSQSQALGFVAVHADGVVLVHDARQRPTTVAAATAAAAVAAAAATAGGRTSDDPPTNKGDGLNSNTSTGNHSGNAPTSDGGDRPSHRRTTSVNAGANGNGGVVMGPLDVVVTRQNKPKKGLSTLNHNGHTHSAIWQLGRATATACDLIRLSGSGNNPSGADMLLLAVAGRDGYLRVVDLIRESPVIAFRSYFGALLCVAWSPDGQYVAAGGEDDLITIWNVADECVVARLQGHTSWVSAVAWDPFTVTPDLSEQPSPSPAPFSSPSPSQSPYSSSTPSHQMQQRYRLGSAGQDAKLLLWDFSLDSLVHRRSSFLYVQGGHNVTQAQTTQTHQINRRHQHTRQVHQHQNSSRHATGGRSSNASATPGSGWKSGKLGRLIPGGNSTNNSGNNGASGEEEIDNGGSGGTFPGHNFNIGNQSSNNCSNGAVCPIPVMVGAARRADVPTVEPVATHVAHGEPLTDVWFDEKGVFTADSVGGIKLWARPPQHSVPELSLGKGRGSAIATSGQPPHLRNQQGLGQILAPTCNDLD